MNDCRRRPSTVFSTLFLAFLLGCPLASQATLIVEGMGGIQQTKIAWNIAGIGGTPNVLSELTFKSTAPKGTLGLRWLNQTESFFIDTTIAYGRMTEGDVRDDDFPENNPQALSSEARALSAATVRAIRCRAAGVFSKLIVSRSHLQGVGGTTIIRSALQRQRPPETR